MPGSINLNKLLEPAESRGAKLFLMESKMHCQDPEKLLHEHSTQNDKTWSFTY